MKEKNYPLSFLNGSKNSITTNTKINIFYSEIIYKIFNKYNPINNIKKIIYSDQYLDLYENEIDENNYERKYLELLAQSVIDHNNINSLYFKINLENLKEIDNEDLLENPNDLSEEEILSRKYDSIGGTLLHQLYNYQKYEICRWIVVNFPEYGLEKYINTPFKGKNILHQTILNKNFDETKWLLDYYSKRNTDELKNLLTATCTGTYYRKTGNFYFGETPLHFAIAMKDTSIFDLLLSYLKIFDNFMDLIMMPDICGNNILHFCILQNSPEFYNHIKMRLYNILKQDLTSKFHEKISEKNGFYFYSPKTIDIEKYIPNYKGFIKIPRIIFFPEKIQDFILLLNDIEIIKTLILNLKKIIEKKCDSQLKKLYSILNYMKNKFNLNTNYIEELEVFLSYKLKDRKSFLNLNSDSDITEEFPDITDKLIKLLPILDNWIIEKEKWMGQILFKWLYGQDNKLNDGSIRQLYEDYFLFSLNKDGYSPLTLSVAKNKCLIFKHLINETIIFRHRFGDYYNYIFDLTGIEFPLPTKDNFIVISGNDLKIKFNNLYHQEIPKNLVLYSAINLICENKSQDMINIFEIKELMNKKWNMLGKHTILHNSILYSVFTFLMILLIYFLPKNINQNYDILILIISLIPSILIFYYEINIFKIFINLKGAGLFDFIFNKIIFSLYFSIFSLRLCIFFLELQNYIYLYSLLVGICTFCCFIYSFLFLMAYYDEFGNFLMTIIHILTKDLIYFARLYFRIIIMFGLLLKTITYNVSNNSFHHILLCMWSLMQLSFQMSINETNYLEPEYVHESENFFFSFIMFCFYIFINVLIINLLIAVITNTYNAYDLISENKLRIQRYYLMEKLLFSLNYLSSLDYESILNKYSNKHPIKGSFLINNSSSNSNLFAQSSRLRYQDIFMRRYFEVSSLVPPCSPFTEKITKFPDLSQSDSLISEYHFWEDNLGNHPSINQLITLDDLNNNIWKPSDPFKIEFCRYILSLHPIIIKSKKSKILLIIHPQNDFCDHLPFIIPVSQNRVGIKLNSDYTFFNLSKSDIFTVWNKKIRDVKYKTDNDLLLDALLVGIKEKNSELFLEVFIPSDSSRKGSLSVPNSYNDSIVISNMIVEKWEEFDEIIISRDCHKKEHISHKKFWMAGPGAPDIFNQENLSMSDILHPANFQTITYFDILNKIWIPVNPDYYSYCLHYTYELEIQKRNIHTIWPNHCIVNKSDPDKNVLFYICKNTYSYDLVSNKNIKNIISLPNTDDNTDDFGYHDLCYNITEFWESASSGHDIFFNLKDSLSQWKKNYLSKYKINKKIDFIDVGFNVYTENYSIFMAESQDSGDPLTGLNTKLVEKLNIPDSKIFIVGETISHCIRFSLENLLHVYTNPLKNIVIVTNAMSSIDTPFYKNISEKFLQDIKNEGITLKQYINGAFKD